MMDPTMALLHMAPPPPPSIASGRMQNLNRKKNWDEAEDDTLVRCWLRAVELNKSGETKSAEFWRMVTDLFQKHTGREEERTDDACNQRFNNLSRACTKWLAARDTVQQNAAYKNRDDDQTAELVQNQYKKLMGTDKAFKHFHVLDMLKIHPKWLEHSANLSQRSREQAITGKTKMQLMGQSKMKLNRDFGTAPNLDYQRAVQVMQAIQTNMQSSLDQSSQANRELDEKISQMAENLTKKVDGLGEVLLLKTVPEADRKALLDAQLVLRMRTLEAQEQEERKRKLELEVLNMELESRKKALMDRALPLPASL